MGRKVAETSPNRLESPTGQGGTAEEGAGQHGPFAAALVKNLEQPGLELNVLLRNVRDEVLEATGGRQEPFVYGSMPSDPLYFRLPL